jgi:hypothetical protein
MNINKKLIKNYILSFLVYLLTTMLFLQAHKILKLTHYTNCGSNIIKYYLMKDSNYCVIMQYYITFFENTFDINVGIFNKIIHIELDKLLKI